MLTSSSALPVSWKLESGKSQPHKQGWIEQYRGGTHNCQPWRLDRFEEQTQHDGTTRTDSSTPRNFLKNSIHIQVFIYPATSPSADNIPQPEINEAEPKNVPPAAGAITKGPGPAPGCRAQNRNKPQHGASGPVQPPCSLASACRGRRFRAGSVPERPSRALSAAPTSILD